MEKHRHLPTRAITSNQVRDFPNESLVLIFSLVLLDCYCVDLIDGKIICAETGSAPTIFAQQVNEKSLNSR